MTDAEAIARSRSDPEAFMVVFERHFAEIGRYLARRLPVDVAAELASETFARAFAARDRYDISRSDARPFLYGIATNLVRRHWRSERRMLRAYAQLRREAVALEAQSESNTELAAALASLTPDEREVLLLYVWADLDYEQIGQALNVPVGTVRSRLNRARGRLRERLQAVPPSTGKEALHDV
jgi:RNA polymerase sigma factor (sigma-70 family)